MNIQSAIIKGANILKDKSINSAKLDSEILLASVIDKDRKYLILNNDQNIKEKNLIHFQKLINKRSFGEPIAYLTNEKFFWNYKFFVTKDTLIPRPDTELAIEHILKLTKHKNRMSVLDIGIGSGCILLTILKERKNFYGTGIDISKNCLNISKINAKNLEVSSRVKFFKSDVDKFDLGKYDLIVSNPPYIPPSEQREMKPNVLNYEPHLALFVPENDPLIFYRSILEYGLLYLVSDGLIYFEINPRFLSEMKSLILSFKVYSILERKDIFGKLRMLRVQKK